MNLDDDAGEIDERQELEDRIEVRLAEIKKDLARLEHAELYSVLTRAEKERRRDLWREEEALCEYAYDSLWGEHGPRRGTPAWKAMMERLRGVDPGVQPQTRIVRGGLPGLGKGT
jgi:hypothetical protein